MKIGVGKRKVEISTQIAPIKEQVKDKKYLMEEKDYNTEENEGEKMVIVMGELLNVISG